VKFYAPPAADGPGDDELGLRLERGFITEEYGGLGPLEVHLLRLLAYSRIASWAASNPSIVGVSSEGLRFFKHQIRCVLISLGRLLFPDTPARMTLPAVELFVASVLGQLYKELKAVKSLVRRPDDPVPDFRHAFADAVGNIIPGVYENLGTLALKVASISDSTRQHYNAAIAGIQFLQPLSWKRHLVPFRAFQTKRANCLLTILHLKAAQPSYCPSSRRR
jgi:hypothetical protein